MKSVANEKKRIAGENPLRRIAVDLSLLFCPLLVVNWPETSQAKLTKLVAILIFSVVAVNLVFAFLDKVTAERSQMSLAKKLLNFSLLLVLSAIPLVSFYLLRLTVNYYALSLLIIAFSAKILSLLVPDQQLLGRRLTQFLSTALIFAYSFCFVLIGFFLFSWPSPVLIVIFALAFSAAGTVLPALLLGNHESEVVSKVPGLLLFAAISTVILLIITGALPPQYFIVLLLLPLLHKLRSEQFLERASSAKLCFPLFYAVMLIANIIT